MNFDDLGLSQPVLQALSVQGYTTPTPIQQQAIPLILEGRDIMGIAQTGTGKTAAFTLPSIDNLRKSDRGAPKKSCRMLVLAPTRELAGQIAKSAQEYGALSGLSVAFIVGGTSVGKDRQKLARGVDILVATPGRLVDLVDQRALTLHGVETLVLDEADQMLDLGFIHALRKIVSWLPKERQTLLFSATMPKSIRDLASNYLNNPAQVSVAPQSTTAEKVDQYVCFVSQPEKQALLTMSLRKGLQSGEMDRVLVFTRTKHGADRVVKKLAQQGIEANAIHGNKSQPQRERALGEFRKGKVRVLVATDIAARGIDIPGVSHVFNFELPNVAEQYVHRIGRTARAGATGMAIAFCASDERDYLRDIQRLTKVTLTQVPLPDSFRQEVERVGADPVRGPRPEGLSGRPRGRNPNAKITPRDGKPRRDSRGQQQRREDGEQRREGGEQRREGGRGRPEGGQPRRDGGKRHNAGGQPPKRNRGPRGGSQGRGPARSQG
ncbi:DEAD/DEAH box helicase [Croceicoccus naphthovorans]|uniref:DEAD-box ATP-dependent RNA helicase RhpA n=1 Tax=Croceicoccus naphthovorans TaxID=1348774 RepID=A0A0G3XIH1_9SPHN|nr:DEAD/DEAH box helicase [Croceicoccus naphthovorans]AKM10416.1 DEAD/DEAH box helicase [Croceicoccus naphthovorans]MBB3990116.1 ATP-dependent RNA helicase RhlE [Croceicoccus naphthovorans]